MSSILPKGIVVNTPEISGDIQKIDQEPLAVEEIAKLWKVYTTTKRRLLDPTAERLENYWWRIWGSRKRYLRGATVARLFADISDGISFVPLRGPINRDESGGRPTTSLTRGPGTASTTAIHSRPESDSTNGRHSSSGSKSSSAMPPPILKKTRGPSSTGPRPTARFISPHSSEEEDATETSPTTSLGAQVVVRPPTPELRMSQDEESAETSTGPRKKAHSFVATTVVQKRRPGVTRRLNSEPVARACEDPPSSSNKDSRGSLTQRPNRDDEMGAVKTLINPHEQVPPPPEGVLPTKKSNKARSGKGGLQKVSLRHSLVSKYDIQDKSTASLQLRDSLGEAESSSSVRPIEKEQNYIFQEDNVGKVEAELQGCQAEAIENSRQPKRREPRSMASDQEAVVKDSSLTSRSGQMPQHRPTAPHPPKKVDTKSSISVASTYTVAMGKTDFRNKQGFNAGEDEHISISGSNEEITTARAEQVSFFAKRPVQPARSASAFFGNPTHESSDTISRSKSQLTLLLEKDRVKDKEGKEGYDSASKPSDAKRR